MKNFTAATSSDLSLGEQILCTSRVSSPTRESITEASEDCDKLTLKALKTISCVDIWILNFACETYVNVGNERSLVLSSI